MHQSSHGFDHPKIFIVGFVGFLRKFLDSWPLTVSTDEFPNEMFSEVEDKVQNKRDNGENVKMWPALASGGKENKSLPTSDWFQTNNVWLWCRVDEWSTKLLPIACPWYIEGLILLIVSLTIIAHTTLLVCTKSAISQISLEAYSSPELQITNVDFFDKKWKLQSLLF